MINFNDGKGLPARASLEEARVQTCETTDRNRIVKAEGVEASWHMTAKPTGSTPTVNAAFVH